MKSETHWKKIGFGPHHGICLPLSALGTFLDLIPLIDWCKKVGFNCIQLLPINDTGKDLSPYNPLSSCALHPKYLSGEVLSVGERSYQIFVKENGWLASYALFKALKEEFSGRHWKDWPAGYQRPEESEMEKHMRVQFQCFSQIGQVRSYAEQQGVYLKGDLPISVSPDSVDVWENPTLFRTDLETGSPPDPFNPLGQKWGFPPFNWEAMRQNGYSWWKQRLQVMEKCFHMYRLDHVVGFFRMWAIPKGAAPTEGVFIPAPGAELLEMMLDTSSMLPIAEDLGTIPKEVYSTLKELGICGTKVIRWQKREDQSFIPFNEYEPLSMTTLSTPDMDPLELWWKNCPAESVPFAAFMNMPYHPILSRKGRLAILRAAHHSSSIFHIDLLQEYLALFPELVWPDPENERINVPGTISPANWTYRFRPSIEEIVKHEGLRKALEEILNQL